MYSKQKEAELIKADNINNLADYYIYDNKPDNDAKAEKMLTGRIKETKDINEKFICMLTLSEYYCIRNDLKKVKKLLAELKGMLPQLDDRLKGNYEMIFNAANDMYTMMQEL